MSIIRRRSDSEKKVGVKKIASSSDSQQMPPIDLHTGPKSTLVSGIVDQLIKNGYKGDLIKSAGMRYAQPDMPEDYDIDNPKSELEEDLIFGDIDFENQQDKQKLEKEKKDSVVREKAKSSDLLEDRTINSQKQIENISKNARVLYGHIDTFISELREAAENSYDNPRLGRKLENLRRMCIGFVRNVEQQMPHYATSLFVNPEEENGRR